MNRSRQNLATNHTDQWFYSRLIALGLSPGEEPLSSHTHVWLVKFFEIQIKIRRRLIKPLFLEPNETHVFTWKGQPQTANPSFSARFRTDLSPQSVPSRSPLYLCTLENKYLQLNSFKSLCLSNQSWEPSLNESLCTVQKDRSDRFMH